MWTHLSEKKLEPAIPARQGATPHQPISRLPWALTPVTHGPFPQTPAQHPAAAGSNRRKKTAATIGPTHGATP